ncbi:MAG: ABC transporter substrate-binding protein, partial [Nitrosopumilus sp.]
SLKENYQNYEYFQNRYDSSIKWIEANNHAVISNGPFYLESYAPESRTITVRAFNDDSYPFKIGEWAEFEKAELPTITNIEMKNIIQRGEEFVMRVEADHSDSIRYFLTNSEGKMVSSDTLKIEGSGITIRVPSEKTKDLGIGANNIKIFAISNSVLKPDFYESSFIVTNYETKLPTSLYDNIEFTEDKPEYGVWIIPILLIIGIVIYLKKRRPITA